MDVLAIFNSVWIQNKLSWSYDGGSCQSNKKYFLTVNNMPNKLGSFEALIYLTIILGTPNKEQNGTNGGATFFKKSWRDPLQVFVYHQLNWNFWIAKLMASIFGGVWSPSKSQLVVNTKLEGGLFMIFWNCPKSCTPNTTWDMIQFQSAYILWFYNLIYNDGHNGWHLCY